MDDAAPSDPKLRSSITGRFFEHLVRMPRWHKSVLLLAAVLVIGGLIGQAVGYVYERSDVGWLQSWSPRAARVGSGFVAGFVIGWVFRAFLKWLLLITGLLIGLFILLSYLNIDVTSARHQTEEAAGWLTTKGTWLKDLLRSNLASGVVGFVGMFVGARRSRA